MPSLETASKISIHTFLAEGDYFKRFKWLCITNFNPHLPCGRWRWRWRPIKLLRIISIHTFLAEGDGLKNLCIQLYQLFQSTPSLRKVTRIRVYTGWTVTISIHTFLAEGDFFFICNVICIPYFNPHLPCGRWLFKCCHRKLHQKFQSTPSLRMVTCQHGKYIPPY